MPIQLRTCARFGQLGTRHHLHERTYVLGIDCSEDNR